MVICAGAEDVDAWVGQVVHHGLVKLAVPALMPANETNMDACTIQARCGHWPCPSILALCLRSGPGYEADKTFYRSTTR